MSAGDRDGGQADGTGRKGVPSVGDQRGDADGDADTDARKEADADGGGARGVAPSAGPWRRTRALMRKELRQLLRDASNLALGVFLPIALILLFGYALSLEVSNAPLAVVLEDSSPDAARVVAGLQLSPTFAPLLLDSLHDAEQLMRARQVDGIVLVPSDFSRRLAAGDAHVQLLVHGADAGRASIILYDASAALNQWALTEADRAGAAATPQSGTATLAPRLWFNAANTSTWYLVPGLIVLIMTLVGAFLTTLVMAREWERGTLEALFVTPARPLEILLAKVLPYVAVGMLGLTLCLLAARCLFHVPLRGSLPIIVLASLLYMLVAVGIGLLISAATKNQFLASQVALVASFMPSLMLSGFLFDLRKVPPAVRLVGHLLPATYFVDLLRALFLAGNVWPLIIKNCAVLVAYAVLLLGLALFVTRKRLD